MGAKQLHIRDQTRQTWTKPRVNTTVITPCSVSCNLLNILDGRYDALQGLFDLGSLCGQIPYYDLSI